MKLIKTLIATMVAAPLFIGSFSALAQNDNAGANHKRGPHHGRMGAAHWFSGVELTQEQKQQIKANLKKDDKKPTNLALHQKPTKEAILEKMLEGVDLSDEQKQQVLANMQSGPKNPHHKMGRKPSKNDASVPMILPELSEQQPVGAIQ